MPRLIAISPVAMLVWNTARWKILWAVSGWYYGTEEFLVKDEIECRESWNMDVPPCAASKNSREREVAMLANDTTLESRIRRDVYISCFLEPSRKARVYGKTRSFSAHPYIKKISRVPKPSR